MAAILAVIFVIAIWWLTTHGKGNLASRLVAWLLLTAAILLAIAINDPRLAGSILEGFAVGIGNAAKALTQFLKQF
jgi:nucleoside permease NupC